METLMITKIVQKDINDLIFAEYNPRQLTKDDYKGIKDSISRFGLVDPIVVNKNKDRKNIIIGGHQRVRVAKDLKYDTVPCVELDLDYNKERELNIRLNKNTGSFDFDILANMFDVPELIEWCFLEKELSGLGEMVLPEIKEPEEPELNTNIIVTIEMTKDIYLKVKDKILELEQDGITINIS